jgi:DNA/RNA endonuclease G (NUC1)
MNYLKISVITLILCGMCLTLPISAQIHEGLRTDVLIETPIYTVSYNEVLQQPNWLEYTSTNRSKHVDRGSMDFHTTDGVVTSDKKDYYKNVWDKGHIAPAATYSDTKKNLYETFSYLNCVLQQQDLNRGEWRMLEAEERKWDDSNNLTIKVEIVFEDGHLILPTGGHVPTRLIKHIRFDETNTWRCFDFENIKPTKGWEEHEVKHSH